MSAAESRLNKRQRCSHQTPRRDRKSVMLAPLTAYVLPASTLLLQHLSTTSQSSFVRTAFDDPDERTIAQSELAHSHMISSKCPSVSLQPISVASAVSDFVRLLRLELSMNTLTRESV